MVVHLFFFSAWFLFSSPLSFSPVSDLCVCTRFVIHQKWELIHFTIVSVAVLSCPSFLCINIYIQITNEKETKCYEEVENSRLIGSVAATISCSVECVFASSLPVWEEWRRNLELLHQLLQTETKRKNLKFFIFYNHTHESRTKNPLKDGRLGTTGHLDSFRNVFFYFAASYFEQEKFKEKMTAPQEKTTKMAKAFPKKNKTALHMVFLHLLFWRWQSFFFLALVYLFIIIALFEGDKLKSKIAFREGRAKYRNMAGGSWEVAPCSVTSSHGEPGKKKFRRQKGQRWPTMAWSRILFFSNNVSLVEYLDWVI